MTKTIHTGSSDIIASVAAAYAGRSDVTIDQIMDLVSRLVVEFDGEALAAPELRAAAQAAAANVATSHAEEPPRPAIPVERAVTEDKVFCLCCGKGFKMLKRHLGAEHGLTEDEYRSLFGLPADMPLVAPSYSERKAAYARKVGLGKYNREEASA